MRKLKVFNHVTLDGYIADAKGDMSWAHRREQDPEWNGFVAENASGSSAFLFGRITYELMASYWPTKAALASDPFVAKRMNETPKFVFSRSLKQASWQNTTLYSGDLAENTRKLKSAAGPDIVIFGSGSVVAQLAQEGLVDEFQIVLNPTALGAGRTMFAGVQKRLTLRHTKTRTFANGNVVLCYEPLG